MVSIEEVQELMEAWVEVPTLTPAQKELVISMRDFSKGAIFATFQVFATSLFYHYPHDITQAIVKARAEGLGAKKH